jgi:hypothetical protein
VDAGAAKIASTPRRTTIARLLMFKRPAYLPKSGTIPEKYRIARIAPIETTAWSVSGTIVNVAYERDGDYRLILADKAGKQLTCVLQDPALAPIRGPFSAKVDAARTVVKRKLNPTLTPRNVRVPARIVGIGYFGRLNSDANKSPEGFQLHPVFSVQFSL